MSIKELTDRILADGVLSIAEHQELLTVINSDGAVDPLEKEQATRVLDRIGDGTLKVV